MVRRRILEILIVLWTKWGDFMKDEELKRKIKNAFKNIKPLTEEERKEAEKKIDEMKEKLDENEYQEWLFKEFGLE